jgi:DNA helicase-2/ATP-dependent DNA helicase PcrA
MDAAAILNGTSLNPAQRAAATFNSGPLLIIAGAGTGKTNTLAHRVAYLIANGLSPARVLLLTFSRRSAREMTKRVENIFASNSRPSALNGLKLPPANTTSQIWGGTFHAIANRLLRLHARPLGLGETFTVLDRSDAEDLLNDVRSDLALDKGDVRFPRKGTGGGGAQVALPLVHGLLRSAQGAIQGVYAAEAGAEYVGLR